MQQWFAIARLERGKMELVDVALHEALNAQANAKAVRRDLGGGDGWR